MSVAQQTQALLDLVETDRARQCQAILGEAHKQAAALRGRAQADALLRVRQAFAEQRQRQREAIFAAQARLATQRRLHAQQRTAALLQRAWAQLPAALLALWQAPASRAAWVDKLIASAQARLPAGGWHIVHAPDWPTAEQQAAAQVIVQGVAQGLTQDIAQGVETSSGAASSTAARFEADPAISAGLKILAQGNVIDGTLAGLLADRTEFEAQLLRQLEPSS